MHEVQLYNSRFRDPMLDHAALVELHLLDRIVFVCDSNIPAVIYRVCLHHSYRMQVLCSLPFKFHS